MFFLGYYMTPLTAVFQYRRFFTSPVSSGFGGSTVLLLSTFQFSVTWVILPHTNPLFACSMISNAVQNEKPEYSPKQIRKCYKGKMIYST